MARSADTTTSVPGAVGSALPCQVNRGNDHASPIELESQNAVIPLVARYSVSVAVVPAPVVHAMPNSSGELPVIAPLTARYGTAARVPSLPASRHQSLDAT